MEHRLIEYVFTSITLSILFRLLENLHISLELFCQLSCLLYWELSETLPHLGNLGINGSVSDRLNKSGIVLCLDLGFIKVYHVADTYILT